MPRAIRYCVMDGCDERRVGQGYCRKHYNRWYKYGDPTIVKKAYRHKSPTCEVEDCENPTLAKGMCELHYARFRRNGHTDLVKRFKGWYMKDGYIYVYVSKRHYEPLHRVLMEQHIGRKLLPDEHMHHIDGDPLNNSISNLAITNRSEHLKTHVQGRPRDENGRFVKSE